jgi:hypothetical protein
MFNLTTFSSHLTFVLYSGCPVAEGHKWAANVWIWNRSRPRFGSNGWEVKAGSGGRGGLFGWLFGSKEKEISNESQGVKIEFSNERSKEVQLFWIKPDMSEQQFGSIGPHGKVPMNTFVGHTWVVRDSETHEKIKSVTVEAGKSTAISI